MSAIRPTSAEKRTFQNRRDVPCVDGSGLAREIVTSRRWSVRPCVRPVSAVHMTAGHNALRGSGPGQKNAFDNAMAQVGCPDRRIGRLCITCCSPSQPSHHAALRRDLVHAASATGSLYGSPVPSEYSDSRVSMVQPTEDRLGDNIPEPLNPALAGRILPQHKVGPTFVIVARILRQDAPKVRFVEYNYVIGALPARRPDQAFNITILPRRPKGCRTVSDAHCPEAGLECCPIRSVIVPNQIPRCRIPRERLRDLARQSVRRRIAGDCKPEQLPALVAEDETRKQLLKRNRWNHK